MTDYGAFSFEDKQEVLDKAKEFWNPGQDPVLDRLGHSPGHRPPRGLPALGHVGPAADRRAPQRRHLQRRPPQPRGRRGRRAGDAALRHRQPPLPVAGADRPRGGADRIGATWAHQGDLRQRRGRSDRHRDQDRPARDRQAEDRLDREGLPRPHGLAVTAGDDRFAKLFLADRPDEVAQVPFNDLDRDGGCAPRTRRRRGADGVDPRDVRLPAPRPRLPRDGQAAVRAVRRALHRRRGADRV